MIKLCLKTSVLMCEATLGSWKSGNDSDDICRHELYMLISPGEWTAGRRVQWTVAQMSLFIHSIIFTLCVFYLRIKKISYFFLLFL